MKQWIETRLVKPPSFTVTGRFGSSVMDVAYNWATKEWMWLQPGGTCEKIAEPDALFLDSSYIVNNLLEKPRPPRAKSGGIRRKKRPEQLDLGL